MSPSAGLGGAERCLLDFVWACRQFDPHMSTRVVSLAHGPLLEELEQLGARCEVLELPAALAELGEHVRVDLPHALQLPAVGAAAGGFLLRLATSVRRFSPDILHTNGVKSHLLGGLIKPRGTRLVVHLHDFTSHRRLTSMFVPKLALRGARYIANSRAVAEDFKALLPSAEPHVLHNVVDTDYFRVGPTDSAWLAAAAGLSPPAPGLSFGLVATYARWKGQSLFLRAAAQFFQRRPESTARFYIIGGPIYTTRGSQFSTEELEREIATLGLEGRAGLIPFQADIARVMAALNVLVHASTQPEPFGRTVVEGMSAARPVIISNAGGVAELFRHGETGLGFECGNAADLCRQLLRLEDDAGLREALGQAGRAWAVAKFSRARLPAELASAFGLG